MKNQKKFLISTFLFLISNISYYSNCTAGIELGQAPEKIDYYSEIAVRRSSLLPDLYNNLSPEERILMYFLFRASLPGIRISMDQVHRHTVAVFDLCHDDNYPR